MAPRSAATRPVHLSLPHLTIRTATSLAQMIVSYQSGLIGQNALKRVMVSLELNHAREILLLWGHLVHTLKQI